jgi:4-hydroxy-tetrahydrodipicolinate synthase
MGIQGVYSVLPTPFHDDGSLDHESLRRVIDLFIGTGVDGLTTMGVTSEVARLSDRERASVLETVVTHVNGRVPVVVGVTSDGLARSIDYSQHAQHIGACAVMVSPPRLARPSSDTVVSYYRALADATALEIVVQDYPPVSGFVMEPALLVRIAREVPTARAIKLEDAPTPWKTSRIRERADGLPLAILGGLGGVFLLEELHAGADGAMTGFAYPEALIDVVSAFRAGRLDEAAAVFFAWVPLMRFEFQDVVGMAVRKEILRRRGVLSSATVRQPAVRLDATTLEALDRVLAHVRRERGATWISV